MFSTFCTSQLCQTVQNICPPPVHPLSNVMEAKVTVASRLKMPRQGRYCCTA